MWCTADQRARKRVHCERLQMKRSWACMGKEGGDVRVFAQEALQMQGPHPGYLRRRHGR